MAAILLLIVIVVEAMLLITWTVILVRGWKHYSLEEMKNWTPPAIHTSPDLAADQDFARESERMRNDYMEVIMNLTEENDG